jgi:hypothetical protein
MLSRQRSEPGQPAQNEGLLSRDDLDKGNRNQIIHRNLDVRAMSAPLIRGWFETRKLKTHPFPPRRAERKQAPSIKVLNISHLHNIAQNGQKMVGMDSRFWE